MAYENLLTTGTTILALFGVVTVITAGVKAIRSWFKPHTDLNKMVEDHSRKLTKDNDRLDRIEDSMTVVITCLHAMMNHLISGNSIDGMKKARDELNTHLGKIKH